MPPEPFAFAVDEGLRALGGFSEILSSGEGLARADNKYAADVFVLFAIVEVALEVNGHIAVEAVELFRAIKSEEGYAVLYCFKDCTHDMQI